MSIRVASLTKKYGDIIGVENLTLNVDEGVFQGFIGPNGAGKSTTIRCLMGMIAPDSGTISVMGMAHQKAMSELKAMVGYLPSEIRLYRHLNAETHLSLSIALRRDAMAAKHGKQAARVFEARAKAVSESMAKRLALDLKRPFGTLSFGNQKKVGIVLSMLHEPRVLILDEATGGLDPLVQETFFELLKERHAAGTTILYSSHVLSEVERYCDKVAIVKSGSVIANESIAHFRQKRLKRVAVKCRPEAIDSCAALLRRHASASRVEVHDHFVQMDWHGMPRALTALMDAIDPIDFTVVEPSLETIFMHYYRETTNDSAMALEHPLPNKA